jgi:hypothetical protein
MRFIIDAPDLSSVSDELPIAKFTLYVSIYAFDELV